MNYSLLEARNGNKIEKFGSVILKRPDPLAQFDSIAQNIKINSTFYTRWSNPIEPWVTDFGIFKMHCSLGKTKHVGVFPEHYQNWLWMQEQLKDHTEPVRVLNLFGYTGGASLACASMDCVEEVVHIDALKSALDTFSDNITLNHLEDKVIRRIQEDALRFLRREAKRGRTYHAIIMDPPSFGRGPKGEKWALEEMMPALLNAAFEVLDQDALFMAINTYSAKMSGKEVLNLVTSYKPQGWSLIPLGIEIQGTQDILKQGTTLRWSSK